MVTGNKGGELHSWKEIAEYLDTTARTAQRWESEKRLPVRRLSGSRGRVVASIAEIDEWKRRDALQRVRIWNNPRWLQVYAGVLTLTVLIGVGILGAKFVGQASLGPPSAFRIQDGQIVILDHQGLKLWTHTFPSSLKDATYSSGLRGFIQYVDLDGDGSVEVLVTYKAEDQMKTTNEIYCFSESGQVLWRFGAGRLVRDLTREYRPPYHFTFVRTLVSPESPHERWVVGTSVHHLSYPSQLVLLDARGKLRGEYWHPGHMDTIEIADLDGRSGPEILVGGENRREGKATMVILDPRKLASLPPPDVPVLRGRPNIAEEAAVLFPRTLLNVQLEEINHAARVHFSSDRLEVQVEEARVQRPSSDLNYVFDQDLVLRAIYPWDTIRSSYKEVFGSPELGAKLFKEDLERMRREIVVKRR